MTTRPLEVLHVIYDDPDNPWVGGGGARRVHELYGHLLGDVRATIATGSYPGARDVLDAPVRVTRLGQGKGHAWSRVTFARAAWHLLHTATFDVAVVDHSGYAPVPIPRARPVGMTVHHLTGPVATQRWGLVAGGAIALAERAVLRRASTLSATSEVTRRALSAIVVPGATIDLVASGVPDSLYDVPRRDEGFVLYLGRLDVRQKGVDVLLDAFADVLRARPDASLRIAGRGPDEAMLRARAAALGIAGAVQFLGAVSDAQREALLAGAAAQVLPSRFEGFGIAAAEALAAGVPLVVADDPALAEIAARAGRVVPRGNATALGAAIVAVLGDPRARDAMTAAGRLLAQRFRWSAVAADHLAFLEHIVRDRGARAGVSAR